MFCRNCLIKKLQMKKEFKEHCIGEIASRNNCGFDKHFKNLLWGNGIIKQLQCKKKKVFKWNTGDVWLHETAAVWHKTLQKIVLEKWLHKTDQCEEKITLRKLALKKWLHKMAAAWDKTLQGKLLWRNGFIKQLRCEKKGFKKNGFGEMSS